MFSSDCGTVTYLANALKHVVLLKKQKHRDGSHRFAIGLPTLCT